MNNITKTLAAILANTAFVWGRCDEQPDLNGLVILPATTTMVPVKVSLFSPNIVATVVHSHDPNCASFSISIGV